MSGWEVLLKFFEIIIVYMQIVCKIWEVDEVIWICTKSAKRTKNHIKIACFGRRVGLPVFGGRRHSSQKINFLYVFDTFWYVFDENDMFSCTEWSCQPQNAISLMFSLHSGIFLIKMIWFHIQNRCLDEKYCSNFSKS